MAAELSFPLRLLQQQNKATTAAGRRRLLVLAAFPEHGLSCRDMSASCSLTFAHLRADAGVFCFDHLYPRNKPRDILKIIRPLQVVEPPQALDIPLCP